MYGTQRAENEEIIQKQFCEKNRWMEMLDKDCSKCPWYNVMGSQGWKQLPITPVPRGVVQEHNRMRANESPLAKQLPLQLSVEMSGLLEGLDFHN